MLVELTSASGRPLREFPSSGQTRRELRKLRHSGPAKVTVRAAAPTTVTQPAGAEPAAAEPAAAEAAATPTPASTRCSAAIGQAEGAGVMYSAREEDCGGITGQDGDIVRHRQPHRTAGVNLDQMLVSPFRENQSAFIDNNMNRIRVGQILRVPGAGRGDATPCNRSEGRSFAPVGLFCRIPAEARRQGSSGAEPWRHGRSDSQRQDRRCGC